MKNPFALIKTGPDHRLQDVVPAPSFPPKPTTSIVGNVVVNLNKGLENFYGQRSTLEAQLTEMTERLRQINAAIHVLELGITEIAEDPALTEEERAIAGRPSIMGIPVDDSPYADYFHPPSVDENHPAMVAITDPYRRLRVDDGITEVPPAMLRVTRDE